MTIVQEKPLLQWEFPPENKNLTQILEFNLHERLATKMDSSAKEYCVPGPIIIGAGPSGLATAACLQNKGVPSLILEKENCIASSWKLRTYERLTLHLPKHFCELPFMPFPKHFPTYPTREQFITYLDSYVDHFSINYLCGVEVECAEFDKSIGYWRIRTNDLQIMSRWLIVATGENSEAFLPDLKGTSEFKGQILHTSCYKRGDDFKSKKVLVVGCGNSGMEVCLDLCNNQAQASMVVRDKLHILPREILGTSTFGVSMFLLKWLPITMVDRLLLFFSWLILGNTGTYGLRRPKIGPIQLKHKTGKTPVLDVGTLSKIKNGQIKVVPAVKRLTDKGVEYTDGKQESFDAIILATGYKSTVASWLKEGEFFNKEDGFPKIPFPDSWKGKNGLYATGFSKRGLLGTSIEAKRIAEDIKSQWNTRTEHLPLEMKTINGKFSVK